MKFKDHLCLGASIFNGLYLGMKLLGDKAVLVAAPFIAMPYLRSPDWRWLVMDLCVFGAFCTGCAFPDTDISKYQSGHRMRSPFHNLTKMLIIYILTLIAAHMSAGYILRVTAQWGIPHIMFIAYIPNAFMGGWLAHLAGDFLQGGIAWGLYRPRKIGCTKFKWNLYTESMFGTMASLVNLLAAAASWAAVFFVGPVSPSMGMALGVWVFSVATYSSCNIYAAAGAASIFLASTLLVLIRYV